MTRRFALSLSAIAFLALSHIAASCPSAMASEESDLVRRGGEVFRRCTACHQIGDGATNRIGPHLNEIFGRTAGTLDWPRYSSALREQGNFGLVWNRETLEALIADPDAFIPGVRMSFRGITDPADRQAVIAYLQAFSPGPSNIPETPPQPGQAAVRDPDLPAEFIGLVGDAEFGEYLSSECLTCHQASGADKGIPSIVGWPVADFARALYAYRTNQREHPVMQMIAGRLSPEEIAALAAYFEKGKP
ncbi:MAG: c-type cytochrome [Rhizobiales bacterium]|nr:c-type cytochrome [Hyphomicrobiales bacterium]